MAVHHRQRWILPFASVFLVATAAHATSDNPDDALRSLLRCHRIAAERDADGEIRSLSLWVGPGRDLSPISNFARLETVSVYGEASDAELLAMARCSGLRALEFDDASAITDLGAVALTSLRELEELGLSGAKITDSGAARLAGMKKLRKLDLSRTPIGDSGLERLGSCPSLEVVNLSHTRVGDAGLATIAKWSALRELDLSNNAIDGSGFGALATLTLLESLDVSNCDLTDGGLARLTPLRRLMSLDLGGCSKLHDEGLATLAHLPFLRSLDLEATQITSAGLASLGPLEFVKSVDLRRTPIDDAAVAKLVTMPSLKFARLDETKVGIEGLRQLARQASRLEQVLPPSHWSEAEQSLFAREFRRLTALGCGAFDRITRHERLLRAHEETELRSEMTRAVERGDVEEVEKQLARGTPADSDTFADELSCAKTTLLRRALALDHTKVALVLIRAGAAESSKERSEHPLLHIAATQLGPEVLDELLRRGAKPDQQDDSGETALHHAVRSESLPCVERLLAAGANSDLANRWGERSIDLAVQRGATAIIEALSRR